MLDPTYNRVIAFLLKSCILHYPKLFELDRACPLAQLEIASLCHFHFKHVYAWEVLLLLMQNAHPQRSQLGSDDVGLPDLLLLLLLSFSPTELSLEQSSLNQLGHGLPWYQSAPLEVLIICDPIKGQFRDIGKKLAFIAKECVDNNYAPPENVRPAAPGRPVPWGMMEAAFYTF